MTVLCPRGHESQTADYCDQCGAPISAAPISAALAPDRTAVLPALEELDTSPSARREPCPVCGAARSGDDRYCEGCGYDFESPPPAALTWEAVVTADRGQFDRLAVEGVSFPDGYGERRFPLREGENRIGRSRGQPDEAPEIDLAAPPVDPGVSRLHAVIERRADGTCLLRDLDSTNGTALNDEPAPITPRIDVPLAEGDRIRVGAWTTITLRRR
jgi:FHA domain